YPLYFFVIASLLALIQAAKRPFPILGVDPVPAVLFVLVLISGSVVLSEYRTIARLPQAFRVFAGNPEDRSFAFVRAHRGEVYLPFKPLVTLMAEGAAYHFSYGLYDRELANLPISADHFNAYLPPQMKYMATDQVEIGGYYCLYMPDFQRKVE